MPIHVLHPLQPPTNPSIGALQSHQQELPRAAPLKEGLPRASAQAGGIWGEPWGADSRVSHPKPPHLCPLSHSVFDNSPKTTISVRRHPTFARKTRPAFSPPDSISGTFPRQHAQYLPAGSGRWEGIASVLRLGVGQGLSDRRKQPVPRGGCRKPAVHVSCPGGWEAGLRRR